MVPHPTIQFVVVILFTKYELSILYSCGDIFDENCREKEYGYIYILGRINSRKSVLNPTIQLVVVYLYTK